MYAETTLAGYSYAPISRISIASVLGTGPDMIRAERIRRSRWSELLRPLFGRAGGVSKNKSQKKGFVQTEGSCRSSWITYGYCERIATTRCNLVKKFEFVAKGVYVLKGGKISINLSVVRARVPTSQRLDRHRCLVDLGEFCSHVLTFRHFVDGFVVHQNVQTLAADPDRANDLCRLDVTLCSYGVDKVLEISLHDVDCAVEIILGGFSNDSRLYIEASDWERLAYIV